MADMMTHSDLVRSAAMWLRKQRCSVVITEVVGGATETPDAFGWYGGLSMLIECKVSRSDFLADFKKPARNGSSPSIGLRRYYLCPEGMVAASEVPEKWGLLEINGRGVRKIKESQVFDDADRRGEVGILLSLLRRIGANAPDGVSIKCYTYETKNTATLGILEDEEPPPNTQCTPNVTTPIPEPLASGDPGSLVGLRSEEREMNNITIQRERRGLPPLGGRGIRSCLLLVVC